MKYLRICQACEAWFPSEKNEEKYIKPIPCPKCGAKKGMNLMLAELVSDCEWLTREKNRSISCSWHQQRGSAQG